MAILQGLPGIRVTVCVEREEVHEYDDNEDEVKPGEVGQYQASKTVSKFIESTPGQVFAINLSAGSPYKFDCGSLAFVIFADGRKVYKPLLQKKDYYIRPGWKRRIDGIQSEGSGGECMLRPFKFAAIKTSKLS
jgi:hypothetical protein